MLQPAPTPTATWTPALRQLARAGLTVALLASSLALSTGCAHLGLSQNEPDPNATRGGARPTEARHVVVQHVLIAFESAEITGVTRSRESAQQLAETVLQRAKRGEDLGRLVRLYSDDRDRDGVYAIANFGVDGEGNAEIARLELARGFGRGLTDAAFRLRPGEMTLVSHHEVRSPLGWHIVRRMR